MTCLSGRCAEKSLNTLMMRAGFCANRNNDSVQVMSLVQNAKGDAALCEECRERHVG